MVCRQEWVVKPGLVLFGETLCYIARGSLGWLGNHIGLDQIYTEGPDRGYMSFKTGTPLGRGTVPQRSPCWVLSNLRRDVCQEIGYGWQDPILAWERDIYCARKVDPRVC